MRSPVRLTWRNEKVCPQTICLSEKFVFFLPWALEIPGEDFFAQRSASLSGFAKEIIP